MDLEYGWNFTFDFDKFILISNLQTTDVSFMPRIADHYHYTASNSS